MRSTAMLLAAAMLFPCALSAQDNKQGADSTPSKPTPTIAVRTADMEHHTGLLGLDYDTKAGKIYLEVPLLADAAHTRSPEMIYIISLPHGAGSNDLGLDRGQIGGSGGGGSGELVYFERSGPKLLMIEPNQQFRSSSTDSAEQASVRESFAESVLWGFKVEAESPDGSAVLVDATDFFVRDARGVTEILAGMHQGNYRFDTSRSALVPEIVKAFPRKIGRAHV